MGYATGFGVLIAIFGEFILRPGKTFPCPCSGAASLLHPLPHRGPGSAALPV